MTTPEKRKQWIELMDKYDFSYFPKKRDIKGQLVPFKTWKPYRTKMPTEEEKRGWCNNKHVECFAVPCESVIVLDIDEPKLKDKFLDVQTLIIETPNGGLHLVFNATGEKTVQHWNGWSVDILGKGANSNTMGEGYNVIKNTPPSNVPEGTVEALLKKRLPPISGKGNADFKARISIQRVLEHYGIKVEKKGKSRMFCCPFHDDKNPSAILNIDNFHCFSCNKNWDVIQLVEDKEKLDFGGAIEWLENFGGVKYQHPQKTGFTGKKHIITTKKEIKKDVVEVILQENKFFFDNTKRLWRYNPTKGIWMWDGEEHINAYIRQNIEGEEVQKTYVINEAISHIKGLTYQARPFPEADPKYICFQNKAFDLNTGKEVEYKSEMYVRSKIIASLGNENAECPKILKFIKEITRNADGTINPEKQNELIEIAAYCLYRGYPIQEFFVLYGRGNEGKSKFLNLLAEYIIGSENRSCEELNILLNYPHSTAMLWNKYLNSCADIDYHTIKNTSTLKRLTGGDPITANFKNKQQFTFINHAKIFFSTNEIPICDDSTRGFFRRARVIHFDFVFDRDNGENKNILREITTPEELQGFTRLLLNKLVEIKNKGWEFSKQITIEEKANTWNALSNPVNRFIADYCIYDKDSSMFTMEFYNRFNEGQKNKGERILDSQKIKPLLQKDPKLEIIKNTTGKIVLYGLRFKELKQSLLRGSEEVEGVSNESHNNQEILIPKPLQPPQTSPTKPTSEITPFEVRKHLTQFNACKASQGGLFGECALVNFWASHLSISEDEAKRRLDFLLLNGILEKKNHTLFITAKGNTFFKNLFEAKPSLG